MFIVQASIAREYRIDNYAENKEILVKTVESSGMLFGVPNFTMRETYFGLLEVEIGRVTSRFLERKKEWWSFSSVFGASFSDGK